MFDTSEPVLEKVFPPPIKGPICKNFKLSNLILNSSETDDEVDGWPNLPTQSVRIWCVGNKAQQSTFLQTGLTHTVKSKIEHVVQLII